MAKSIKRRVSRLDVSNQGALFPPCRVEVRTGDQSGAVQFEDLDPRHIRINEVPLEQVLKDSGQRAPLRVRALLCEMSFAEFESAYLPGGRRPYAPRAMIGIVLSGILQGITSLRELERYARLDVGCWWISGGIMPDHSILGRFIQRHEGLLTEEFFQQLTRQVLKATGSGVAVVAGDGTIIEAAASRYRVMKAEALREARKAAQQKLRDAADEPARAKHGKRVEQLQEAQQALSERQGKRRQQGKQTDFMALNVAEPQATLQVQKDKVSLRASYKPSIMANEARVIVAQQVHPCSETQVLPALFEQARRHGRIDTAMFDAGYFAAQTLTLAAQGGTELLCPQGRTFGEVWEKTSQRLFNKNRFVYDSTEDCYRCPGGQRLTPVHRCSATAQSMAWVKYATQACAECPVIRACTRSRYGRAIKRYECDADKDALRARMADPQVRARYRRRSVIVEPVFSYLRGSQGLNRFRRKGLKAVRLEFALHAMAYNLGRALMRSLLILLRRLTVPRHRHSPGLAV